MTEHDEALQLANKILDRVNADPDDDLAMLARQLLRTKEAHDAYAKNLAAITKVCGLAGIGSRGQTVLSRVLDLSVQLGHQIRRADKFQAQLARACELLKPMVAIVNFPHVARGAEDGARVGSDYCSCAGDLKVGDCRAAAKFLEEVAP